MTTPYWLFGVPFDLVTLRDVRQRIFAAADTRRQLVFATPNVSFIAQASRDARFRDDILRVDLSLADGMPIVWLGSLLGVPFAQRVAGSDLLDSLIAEPGPRPLRVFFFGGNPGAADAAMAAVNRRAGGMVAVGALDPGFSAVDEMSDSATIDAINRTGADFLVVALGAAKGHRWIEANRERLQVPVISHLGAAINFVAGRLQRAPRLMQRIGLEWLWRIKEEPLLFRRYARDAWFLALLVAGFVVPELLRRASGKGEAGTLSASASRDGQLVVRITNCLGVREVEAFQQPEWAGRLGNRGFRIELQNVSRMDAAGVGWLYAARYRKPEGGCTTVHGDQVSIKALQTWRAECLTAGGLPA